jgi:hypothetical protein
MPDHIARIAQLLTEDPDSILKSLNADDKRWDEETVASKENSIEAVKILAKVASDNGCILDQDKITTKLKDDGFTLRNVIIRCEDPAAKQELKQRLADTTGDESILNSFDKNLHASLYQAINAEFADRLKEEAGLEVSHVKHEDEDDEDTSGDHVDIPIVVPAIRAKPPEEAPEDLGMEGGPPPPEEPLEAPGAPPEPLGAPPEEGMPAPPPGPPMGPEGAEPEMGEFGVEPPEEELGPPDEDEAMINFEQVQRIADLLTEDPDIFNL